MTIHFDRSQRSVVLICDDCGWRTIAPYLQTADALARAHQARAHPGDRTLNNQLRRRLAGPRYGSDAYPVEVE